VNSCLPTRLLSLVLIALGATVTVHATQVALIADASVNSVRSSTNFGGLSNLYIGNGSTTFLRFDLSTLPAGTTTSQIAHATLTVFVNRVNAAGSVTLSPAASTWTEIGITGDTMPDIGASANTFTASMAGQFIALDVTSMVQGWVAQPSTNFGFVLGSAAGNLLLDSKENDETGHSASLDITITSAGDTGLQGIQGPQGIQGSAGLMGAQGLVGTLGPMGAAGLPGAAGIPGVAGAVGATGATGALGASGAAGIPGVAGAVGATGATGALGASGATGATGTTGAIGPFVGGNYSNSVDYPAGSVVSYTPSTYLAVQANGPSTTTITPGSDSAYWVTTAGSGTGSTTPASYIDVSATVAAATVAIGAEVFAATASPLVTSTSGFMFNSTTGTVTVAVAGTYTYDYDVSVAEPGVLALTNNGVFVPGTSFGRSTGTTQIIGHGQIALAAGDVVGLISDGSAAALTLYAITPIQNIAAFSLVATAGTQGATGPQGPQGVPGVNGLPGTNSTGVVSSIAVGTVTTSGATGTVSIGGTATTPTININFPASSAGFIWTTSFQAPTDFGPDNVNPITGAIALVAGSGTQTPEFAFAPLACIATSLQVFAVEVGTPSLQGPIVVTAQDNGTNTSMSCQLQPNLPGSTASTCSSLNTFSVNAGDTIQYSLTQIFPPPTSTTAFVQVGTTLTCQAP
jgi:hypothetical protein